MSENEASVLLQAMDRELKKFPEVASVFGKEGRAESPTDPAPLGMAEVTVVLKPRSEWRKGLTWDALVKEMDQKLHFPGMPNVWWMPIQTRTEMLATGVRAPLGIEVFGDDLDIIEKAAISIEHVVSQVPGTRSAFAERSTGGFYVDFDVKRDEAARHGLTVEDVNRVVAQSIGGEDVSETVEGRQRFPINVRYARELRDDPALLGRILIGSPDGAQIPLSQVVTIRNVLGPPMIRSEGGKLVGFVFVDTEDPLPTGARLERLGRADAGVLHQLDEFEPAHRAVRHDPRPLGVQADAFATLLLGAHAHVAGDFPHAPHVASARREVNGGTAPLSPGPEERAPALDVDPRAGRRRASAPPARAPGGLSALPPGPFGAGRVSTPVSEHRVRFTSARFFVASVPKPEVDSAGNRRTLRLVRFAVVLFSSLLVACPDSRIPDTSDASAEGTTSPCSPDCNAGQFCFAQGPPDAAPPASCQSVPPACTSNPSCACLGPSLCGGNNSCTYDELAGYVVLQCVN
jgi:hypothetical protein